MVFVRNTALTTASLVIVTLAGCVTTHGNLTSSADRLERNAAELARDTRDEPSGSDYSTRYSRDARELADRAHEFRRTVDDSRADSRDVRDAFEQVSRSYHALREDVDHSESHHAQADLRPVTEAYLDVEREMGGYPDDHRYARDADTRERDRY
jgi:chromosome segregation ATPase